MNMFNLRSANRRAAAPAGRPASKGGWQILLPLGGVLVVGLCLLPTPGRGAESDPLANPYRPLKSGQAESGQAPASRPAAAASTQSAKPPARATRTNAPTPSAPKPAKATAAQATPPESRRQAREQRTQELIRQIMEKAAAVQSKPTPKPAPAQPTAAKPDEAPASPAAKPAPPQPRPSPVTSPKAPAAPTPVQVRSIKTPAVPVAPAAAEPAPPTPRPQPQPVVVEPAAPAAPEKPALALQAKEEEILQKVEGKKLYSFRAVNTEIKTALAMFARANKLNIVPDADVTGTVTLDVSDLPLEQMMRALLEANDYTWEEDNGLIRVRAYQTETFQVDYLRLSRTGRGQNAASLSAASSSGRGGAGGGMGGGGGGMGGGLGGSGTQGGSAINLTADNPVEFWKELQQELEKLLTDKGKETMAINMTAGLIQITDRPSALKRVASYLKSLEKGVERQVDIEARLYDVMLSDEYQLGIDWNLAAQAGSAQLMPSSSTIVNAPIGGLTPAPPSMRVTGIWSIQDGQVNAVLDALQKQGEVRVISKPRIRTLNNQTALIKVGTETPFFSQRSTFVPGVNASGTTVLQDDQVTTITVGTILSITPQISDDGWITLDISPVLTSLVDTELSPSQTTTAPVLDIKQASTIVRVRDGSTIVMGGLIQDSKTRTVRKVPIVGDIPLLGKLFQGRFEASQKKELVIFLTPRIVRDSL
ncbi:MAG: pilus (MSHA type) biogenesis protein MshL [Verrucomicrobia bacterium]|nr:MAG: pilus (MSHA type) biogenesis protein MshL [Verrucomicrobiota bacterium]